MYRAIDIARMVINYCTNHNISLSNLKLQKVLYFLWVEYYKHTGNSLFEDDICAWQLGPVVPEVYFEYCQYAGNNITKNYTINIPKNDLNFLLEQTDRYAKIPASRLVNLTHAPGTPWSLVFNGGRGNHKTIPFDLIETLES